MRRGYQVNQTMRERLKRFAQSPGIQEPIRVHVPAGLGGIQFFSARTGNSYQAPCKTH